MVNPVSIKVIPLSSHGPQSVELISSTLHLQPSPLWRHIPPDLNLLKSLLFVYNVIHTNVRARAHTHTHTHKHTHTNSPQNFLSTTSLSPASHLAPHRHINLLKCIIYAGSAVMSFHMHSSTQCSSYLMPPFY